MRAVIRHSTRHVNRSKTRIGPLAAVILIVLVLTAVRWIAAHLILGTVLTVLIAAAAVVYGAKGRSILRSRKAGALAATDPHRLDPGQFERFIADLCRRDHCRNVQVVGGAGDLAADVLYVDPHGRRGLIQAKRYQRGNSVGNEHVQMVNGTYRDAHGCTHASIVTTSHFTAAAQQYAQHVGIALLDDNRLNAWIRGQRNAAPWN